MLIFAFLFILSVSGCASGAAGALPVLRFMMFLVVSIAFLFLPNSIFSGFGLIVSIIASGFSLAQGILFIDMAITWNDTWAELDLRAHPGGALGKWKKGLLGASAAFVVIAIGLVWYLAASYPDGGAVAVTITALVVSLLLLVLNIVLFSDQAGLLPSTAVMAFAQWLAWQTVAAGFDEHNAAGRGPPAWLSLSLGVASLFALVNFGLWGVNTSSSAEGNIELSRVRGRGGSPAVDEESSEATTASTSEDVDAWDFGTQCAVHAVAAAYVASILAPGTGWGIFAARLVALSLCLVAYGWVLVAPTVFKDRNF